MGVGWRTVWVRESVWEIRKNGFVIFFIDGFRGLYCFIFEDIVRNRRGK